MTPIVTIDGPAASGKSSVSRLLAQHLGWKWVSTGAFYRGLAYVAFEMGVSSQDEKALVALANDPIWAVEMTEGRTHVLYNGQDVTAQINHEDVGGLASTISRHPGVRAALLQAQRNCALGVPGLIAEGRDCGSVVFPQAPVKLYLTASSEGRAARRALEQGLAIEHLVEVQKQRDAQDKTRKTAPLLVPDGAYVIDTTEMDLDQVVERALEIIRSQI